MGVEEAFGAHVGGDVATKADVLVKHAGVVGQIDSVAGLAAVAGRCGQLNRDAQSGIFFGGCGGQDDVALDGTAAEDGLFDAAS